MKKPRFSEEQMVTILRAADQRPVPKVAKQHGLSAQTIDAWLRGRMAPGLLAWRLDAAVVGLDLDGDAGRLVRDDEAAGDAGSRGT